MLTEPKFCMRSETSFNWLDERLSFRARKRTKFLDKPVGATLSCRKFRFNPVFDDMIGRTQHLYSRPCGATIGKREKTKSNRSGHYYTRGWRRLARWDRAEKRHRLQELPLASTIAVAYEHQKTWIIKKKRMRKKTNTLYALRSLKGPPPATCT